MITINYSDALCGAGKTYWACKTMAHTAGCYVYAVDRRDVFATRTALIQQFADEHGTAPDIVELYSLTAEWPNGLSDVRRAVREAGCQYAPRPHVVVVITHEALKSSDLSTYSGWTCIIDEVPSIWTHGEIKTPASSLYLAAAYNLRPSADTSWSEVQIKAGGALLTDIHNDTLLSGLAEFHRQVRDRGVFVNLRSWGESADGKAWSWIAMWNPEVLKPFESVALLGNALEYTLTYKLLVQNFGHAVTLVPFGLPQRSTVHWQPRTLLIRYFARVHRAGSTFWRENEDGRECLRRIPWWINAHTDPDDHYWSCNTFVDNGKYRDALNTRQIIGQKVLPKVAGLNSLRHLTCGTFLYSAKPSDAERHAFDLFGVSAEDIIRSREYEDLIQMLWRSSLRNPDDGRQVEFRVYDRWQAEFLCTFVHTTAPHVTVTLEHIDLGLDAFRPKQRGRPKTVITGAEAQIKADRTRDQARRRQRRHRGSKRTAP